ncbi:hypothetical protein PENTCL1PPCAC_5207, partial [Pristionchus entomophagus]
VPLLLSMLLLAASALGCIPMTPTSPGIPAMPSVPTCKTCTGAAPFIDLKTGNGGVWMPTTINTDGECAVGTFTCIGNDLDISSVPEGVTGGDFNNFSGTNPKVILKCNSDGVWETVPPGGVQKVVYAKCSV